jgi:glycerol-3-phosphate dehydrogenase
MSTDIIVVGGGIQGATAACEATRRGSSVLLLERDDLGSGASSASMHIAHGGLRYLQSLDLGRSRQSIRERRRLLRLAPDWVRPQRFRLDLTGRKPPYRWAFAVGLLLNDLVSLDRNRGVRPDRHLPGGRVPTWTDAFITDTERLLLAFLHTARRHRGSLEVRTHTEVTGLLREGGRVVGVTLADGTSARATTVIDCTGASATPAVLSMNLVVPRPSLVSDGVAVALRHPRDGRNLFVVPWEEAAIVGTWNQRMPGGSGERREIGRRDGGVEGRGKPLHVDPAWVEAALEWVGGAHPDLARLGPADVRAVQAGLVPAAASGDEPSDTERLTAPEPGLVVVEGVKWTTAFGLSERAVALARGEAVRAFPPIDAVGAAPLDDGRDAREALVGRLPHGAAPVAAGTTLRRGDVVFAVEEEWARSLSDVLLRRVGVSVRGHPGDAVVRGAAEVLAQHRGWDPARVRAEIAAFEADFRVRGPLHSG